MRRLSLVVLLAIAASLLVVPVAPAQAATFRNHVARIPASPTSQEPVRVWMQSDTAFGETAGLEYNPVGTDTYVKVLGTFDTSGPAPANWRADIPAFAAGTQVRYQLFTRNEFGSDYGFTGFNWSFTVENGDVQWNEVLHDSFNADYRSPVGPVTVGSTVRLRLRTAQGDITGARVRVWNDRTNSESLLPMSWDGVFDTSNSYDWWVAELPTGADPTVLYYFFELTDRLDQDYYVDDDPKFYGGGFGAMSDGWDDSRGFQITAYDPAFDVPDWMQRAIIYQIFPDRFRDGNPANNPQAGRFAYAREGGAIVRSNDPEGDWNSAVCDPRVPQTPCTNYYGDNFYGGDLRGVIQKIEDGYLSSLGVTAIYLNPIFRAPSNHKYDTANFLEIDPDFGTLQEFRDLVAAANARGIKLMLDGVFNHTSSDSPYFDYYSRYDANGNLSSPAGPGVDDNSGACEGNSSPFYSWFYFGGSYGSENGGTCPNGVSDASQSYRAWYGYGSLPKLNSALPAVRSYFYGGPNAVGPYWTREGASGWRFDVGADVDSGLTNDPGNSYWEEFRAAVRNQSLTGKSDVVMLGEEWGDASAWLLGNEWDSVMNYRFRSAVLSWLFTGCAGNGCAGGTTFQENDSNDFSSSGPISALSPSQFNARLRSIQEDYPPMAFKAMMNLAGSHDTQRLRFLLKKINNDNDAAAVQRMKEWWLFAFTYAGAPTLYYGDEVGLSHDGVWDGSQYQDDPYNRAPFPWPDASGGSYVPDTANLQAFARHMASVRQSYGALQDGDVQHGLVIDDARQLYGFARTDGAQTALVLLNRSGNSHSATFSGLNAAPYNLPDGTALLDAISGATYTVSGGAVTVNVTPSWGAVLLERSKIDRPAAAGLSVAATGANVQLEWPAVVADGAGAPEVVTRYEVHRGASAGFTPGAGSLVATLTPPSFGSVGGLLRYADSGAASGGYVYIVRACNAAGMCADTPALAPTKQSAVLALDAAAGVYGGSVSLRATLSSNETPLAGYTVSFSLNGQPAGTDVTDASGVATLSASLAGIDAGSYPAGVTASFAGDSAYNPAASDAPLTIAKADQTVSLSGVPATRTAGQSFTVSASASSGLPVALSVAGPCSLSGATVTTTAAGTCTVTANQAGDDNYNPASASASVTVTAAGPSYTFTGFFQPVDNPPTVNVVNAGRAIPVKFRLGGNFGLNIFAAESPSSGPLACSTDAPSDAIETTVPTTASGLSYDAATDQYTYVWKTEKSWANSCRQLVLTFADGTTKTATFRFSR